MVKSVNKIIEEVLSQNPSLKNLTSVQKGRIVLDFIDMSENPDDHILHNRYLD